MSSADEPRFARDLVPELAAHNERLAADGVGGVDATLLPPAQGRAFVSEDNRRNNRDLPPLAFQDEVVLPADPALGAAATRLLVIAPPGETHGTLLFVHGGGFAFCTPETHLRCAAVLAHEAGMTVVLPDYRLAPEHPFPAGLMDSVAALRAVTDRPGDVGLDPGPVVVAGDSAGANLALAAMLHEQAAGRALPAGALLFYGVFGADFETPSYRFFADGPGLTRAKMQRYWDWYLADPAARADPLAAPLAASDAALAALPPLSFTTAGIDPLLSDTLLLVERLRGLGRSDPLDPVEGVTHGFLQLSLVLREARAALARAGRAARGMTGRA